MIIENPSPYFKVVDFDGKDKIDIVINNEGEKVESNYKNKDGSVKFVYQFSVILPNGVSKIASLKGKQLTWMILSYGKDSANWKGKTVPAYAMRKQVVAGKPVDYV